MNRLDKEMGIIETIGMCTIFVALILAAMIFLPPSRANGESLDVISIPEYDVWDVELGKEKLVEITFDYHDNILAMYWDTTPVGPLWVKVWAGIEAVDAGEILPMRLNQPTTMQR